MPLNPTTEECILRTLKWTPHMTAYQIRNSIIVSGLLTTPLLTPKLSSIRRVLRRMVDKKLLKRDIENSVATHYSLAEAHP